jgi:Xaa-Pro aminopeptidase
MLKRVSRLKEIMAEERIDVAFILKPHDVFYFSGYSSVCSGVVILPSSDPIFCTLWLDAPEAKQLCTLSKVASYMFPGESLMGRMVKLFQTEAMRAGRIGVEKDFISLRDYELLVSQFPHAEIVQISPMIDRMRAVKDPEEIAKMKKSAAIADLAMEAALKAVRPGTTESEVAAEAEYVMRRSGSEKTAFSTFVASGPRTLLAHPVATQRVINSGDPVVIDLGATWCGYASDICRTTFAGGPTRAQVRRLKVVVEAQQAAAGSLRDGALSGRVFEAAYRVFKEHKVAAWLPDDIGYGVGLRQSEFYPVIERNSRTVLKENMVVALLHTTAYEKTLGGLRVEDTFLVTKEGCEKLTTYTQPFV